MVRVQRRVPREHSPHGACLQPRGARTVGVLLHLRRLRRRPMVEQVEVRSSHLVANRRLPLGCSGELVAKVTQPVANRRSGDTDPPDKLGFRQRRIGPNRGLERGEFDGVRALHAIRINWCVPRR